ncbi:MAG: WbqC family protein [Chitinophagaceae bacterium]|nr:WbqC family protein [Chitinophagaceae bacterium]
MTLVSDLQYFPSVIFFYELDKYTHCIFDQYEEYRKISFRNRCTLSGANGKIDLSIPLVGGRSQKTLMKDVTIDNKENWRARHWKTITSCYNKSPWFDHYRDELEQLYSSKPELLIEWNQECFKWVCDKMSIKTSWSLSSSYIREYNKNEFKDWRNHLVPNTLNKLYPLSKRYPQVFEERHGFITNLSILDYLFCQGNKL